MLFLMNDVVLNLEARDLAAPLDGGKLANLPMDTVSRLGAELYALDPLLHQTQPDRAKRLAALILIKQPQVNAVLFLAPSRGCKLNQVTYRYAQVAFEVISGLYVRQQEGSLTTVAADREVWRRLAA
jgi:hypothetical protein